MFYNFKKKLLAVVFIGFFTFVVFILIPQQQTEAISGLPFGGTISSAIYCTCSANMLITVSAPVPANLTYETGMSHIFANGQIFREGPYVLGNYSAGGLCLMYVGVGCSSVPLPPTGTIVIAGTSI